MEEKIRCVMVGLGSRGQYLLQQVLQHPNYEVVALAEPNTELLRQAQHIAGAGEDVCYTDLNKALTHSGAQACVINTPPHLHGAHLEASFAHNLPAFVAKPLTRDFGEARRLVELAEARKLALLVDQQTRFDLSQRKLAEYIADGRFGRLGFGTCTLHRCRPNMENATDENPFLWEQSVHSFNSLLVMIGRRALRVRAYQAKPSWSRYNGPTVVMGVIEFEGSEATDAVVPIQFFGTYAAKVPQSEIHLEFSEAAIKLEEGDRVKLSLARNGEEAFEELELPALNEPRALEQYNLDNFYRAVREGVAVPNNGRENMRTLALVDAFITSSRTGRETEVADVG